MRKAVANWKLAQYWQDRAASALRHAQYKELPAVRARRIKGIEADIRRCKAAYTPRDNARILQRRWNDPADAPKIPHAFCGTGSRGGSWVAVEDLPKIEAKIANGLPKDVPSSAASADKKKEDDKGG